MTIFILACLSAFLSHARTIAVIVILQLLYYGYWTTRSSGGLLRLRALVITAFVSMVMLAGFAESLSSLGDRDVQSNISRIGATVTAMRVAMAYPYFGIGIGQLKYFFGAYAPDFALASDEILTYATRLSEYRASAFNLFVRFFCEFGFAVGAAFSFVVLRPIFTAVRRASADSAVACATLSAIGGAGFWLSQDQYGYQPGILSLAILAGVLSAEPNDRPRRPS
jgi:hypothetical protein